MHYRAGFQKFTAADFGRVAVLMGGTSAEREVSLQSGKGVLQALLTAEVDAFAIELQDNYAQQLQELQCDRAFIALHSGFGENGLLQAFLQAKGIPFTGSGFASSSLCMDKARSKAIWQAYDLPTAPFVLSQSLQEVEVFAKLHGYPLAIKPNSAGSTFGVSCVTKESELATAFAMASRYDSGVLVEPWIKGEEYTISLLNNQVLPAVRIVPTSDFFDYEAKYQSAETQFFCPSQLSASEEQALLTLVASAFDTLGVSSWGRVDCMRDEKGQFWLLEVNTIPGLTSHSTLPLAAASVGLSYQEVILEILFSSLTKEQVGSPPQREIAV